MTLKTLNCKLTLFLTGLLIILANQGVIAQSARIYSITGGKVQLQRERRKGWSPIGKGAELRVGDKLWPEPRARVIVSCLPKARKERVPPGVPAAIGGKICGDLVVRIIKGPQAAEILGGVDAMIPYLISPRHSLVLSDSPLLRWNPVAGATQYQLEVNDASRTVWKTQTQATRLVYAGEPLQPGVAYSVKITANIGKSSQEDKLPKQPLPASQLDFRILRPAEAAQIRQSIEAITATSPTDIADVLAISQIYADYTIPESTIAAYNFSPETYATYSLTHDAISLLESAIQQGQTSPLIYRTLGELYWKIGLANLAIGNYQQAINRVRAPEDLEDWTLTHHNSGYIHEVLDNHQLALQHYRQARAGYWFLDDPRQAKDLQTRINQLEKLLRSSE
jgi:hypothetical protein